MGQAPLDPVGEENLVRRFATLWDSGAEEPDVFSFLSLHRNAPRSQRAEVVIFDHRRRLEVGRPLPLERYFEAVPDLEPHYKLAMIDYELQHRSAADPEHFAARFPEFGHVLRARIRFCETRLSQLFAEVVPDPGRTGPVDQVHLGSSEEEAEQLVLHNVREELLPACEGAVSVQLPARIGKYAIKSLLAVTKFKEVYLGCHELLRVDLVVKVAKPGLIAAADEARILARLHHPGIVEVYDAGYTEGGRFYFVEQFVKGADLATKTARARLSHEDAAGLVALVADALHYVHCQGVFHRDVKPANILITKDGRPLLTDFGLALRVEDLGKGWRQGGTVAYMSPEQARGEAHLVDGRTDIYSLGVVLYELLVGQRPFSGSDARAVLEHITTRDIRPPRQIDDSVPKELERICLKASARRIRDRYTTARDMAEDLWRFLAERDRGEVASGEHAVPARPRAEPRLPARVVHKGLRPFSEEDADFFLELLPGQRGRDGVPESVRFWVQRIDSCDPQRAFRVGVLYGPSGAGKTSFVRAGVLPRLADHVHAVCVEATPNGTGVWLLENLKRRFPHLASVASLREALAELRTGQGLCPGHKVLVVVDQFEQCLQGDFSVETSQFTQALRHCDGEHLQCLLLVRDGFWLAVTRFMQELEIPLEEGNSAGMDLFDQRHARRVLAAFGQAYDIAGFGEALTPQAEAFCKRAAEGLAVDRKVMPVRLALFVQIMKDREWSLRTLREIGGALGVGEVFLIESFDSPRAPPACRLHRRACMAVLQALLPEAPDGLQGAVRSASELAQISLYTSRPRDFQQLMGILERELRLLAPVDPLFVGAGTEKGRANETYYKLAHDYMVSPVRSWLTRRQRETARGRAELKLAERAELCSARPERKQLPSLWEWLQIVLLTRWRTWTEPQANTMRSAAKLHAMRAAVALAALLVLFGGFSLWRGLRVNALVRRAEACWKQAPGSAAWKAMCAHLENAYAVNPRSSGLEGFLHTIARTGSLAIRTTPADARIEIQAADADGQALGIELASGFAGTSARSITAASGERIFLHVGYYRVEVTRPAYATVRFPVFVGQQFWEKGAGGWDPLPDGVRPRDVKPDCELLGGAFQRVRVAEAQHIGELILPRRIPADMVYVPPGPTWTSRPAPGGEQLAAQSDQWKPALGLTRYRLARREVPRGFLIGTDEVSIGEVLAWLDRYGDAPFAWREEYRARQLYEGTFAASSTVVSELWNRDAALMGKLRSGSKQKDFRFRPDLTVRELCRERGQREAVGAQVYRSKLRKLLEQENPRLPAGYLNFEVALQYARTHRGINNPEEKEEFTRWVGHQIAEARLLREELVKLEARLRARSATSVEMAALPADIALPVNERALYAFGKEGLCLAYLNWLESTVRCTSMLPVRSILRWAEEHRRELGTAFSARLGELMEKLTGPPCELWHGPWGGGTKQGEDEVMHLVWKYVADLKSEAAACSPAACLPKENFLLWLGYRRSLLEERLGRLEVLAAHPIGEVPIPWDLRLEFGHWRGWSLPTADQWEKACRGADSRSFPWGRWKEGIEACLGPGKPGPTLRAFDRLGNDRSPYGVWGMAGGVSEFIIQPDFIEHREYMILKGGNFKHMPIFANAGCYLGIWGLDRARFAGFRVVREIRSHAQPFRVPVLKPGVATQGNGPKGGSGR